MRSYSWSVRQKNSTVAQSCPSRILCGLCHSTQINWCVSVLLTIWYPTCPPFRFNRGHTAGWFLYLEHDNHRPAGGMNATVGEAPQGHRTCGQNPRVKPVQIKGTVCEVVPDMSAEWFIPIGNNCDHLKQRKRKQSQWKAPTALCRAIQSGMKNNERSIRNIRTR